jgi:hypothetical protein
LWKNQTKPNKTIPNKKNLRPSARERGGEGLSGVSFSLYEIISTHAAEGFLSGQVELVKKAI